jgi:hypothetical protein
MALRRCLSAGLRFIDTIFFIRFKQNGSDFCQTREIKLVDLIFGGLAVLVVFSQL